MKREGHVDILGEVGGACEEIGSSRWRLWRDWMKISYQDGITHRNKGRRGRDRGPWRKREREKERMEES